MKKSVRILIVENEPSDADLAMSEIRRELRACQFQVVKTRKSFIRSLEAFQPNVILASLTLPRLDGINALRLTLQHAPLTPVIIWADASAEGIVVDCMKAGADNYINKGNLSRLGPAILEALEENDRRTIRLQADKDYQSIFDNSIEGVFRSSPQGHYLSLNEAMARIYGYETPEEMITSVRDIATQIYVEPDKHAEFMSLLISQKSVEHFETRNYRKDGSIIWTSSSAWAEQGPNGEVLYYEGFTQDITPRKQMEEELRNNERRFRALIENGLEDISLLAADGRLLWESPSTLRNLGYAPDEFVGRNIFDIMHPEDLGWTGQVFNELLHEPGGHRQGTFRLRRSDGTWRWVEAIATNLLNESSVNAVVINYRDITERRLAEEALLRSEQRYRALFEDMPVAIWEEDFSQVKQHLDSLKEQGVTDFHAYFAANPAAALACAGMIKILKVNNTAVRMYEAQSKEQLIEITDNGLCKGEIEHIHEVLADIAEGRLSNCWEGGDETLTGRPIEIRLNWSVAPVSSEDDFRVIVTTLNITERKRAEEALRQSQNRYRTLIETQTEFVVRWRPDGGRTFANEAYCRYFGLTPDLALSGGFMPLVFEEDRHLVEEKIGRLLSDESTVETDIHRVIRPDGSLGWQEWTDQAIRDQSGTLVELQSVGRDITERRQAEIERQALLEIMQGLALTNDLQELLELVHHSIARVIYAENFFVMLHQDSTGLFEEIYSVDQYDPALPPSRLEESITSYVFRTGKPLLLSRDSFDQRVAKGEMKLVGTDSASWLGVPLKTSGRTIGVMAVQDYENRNRYSEHDKEFLASIAAQVALVIERKRAEEALRESEERFGSAFEYASIGIALVAPDGHWLRVNRALSELIGYSEQELIRKTFQDITHPEDLEGDLTYVRQLLAGEIQSYQMEKRYFHKRGHVIWVLLSVSLVRDNRGEPLHFISQIQDITERRRTEDDLRASEERFRQLVDNIQEAFWITDAENGREIYLSPAMETIWGCPIQLLMREPKTFFDSIFPEDRLLVWNAIEREKRGENVQLEYRIVRPDGSQRWIWDRAFPILDNAGNVIRIAGISADITERKEAAEKLRESEDRYHTLFQNQLHGSALHEIVTDDQGKPVDYLFLKVNPAFEKMTGLKAEEIIGRRVTDVLPDMENGRLIQVYGQVALTGEPAYLNEYFAPLGRFYEINAYAAGPRRFAVSFIDVTERRESAMALQKSQSRYRELFDSSPVSIWEEDFSMVKRRIDALLQKGIIDPKEYFSHHPRLVQALASLVRITDINQASMDLYRTSQKADLLKGLVEALGNESVGHFQEELLGLLSPMRKFVWEGTDRTFDGQELDVIVTGSIPQGYEDDWSKVIVSIIDITQRKQAEQNLRKLSRAVEQSGSTIVITDTSGRIEYVNPKFTQITGYSSEEVIGKNPRMLKSGFTSHEEYEQLWQTITRGQEWHGELLNKKKDGTLFWESVTISPVLNDRREITHFVGVKEDITERKHSEIETRRHIAELEAVYENGLSVGRLVEPREIGNRLIETFARYLPWHHVTIRLRKENSDDLELVAFNLPDLREEEKTEVERHFTALINKVGQGLSGWVIQTGVPLRTGNVHAHPQYVDTHEGIQSGLYMPLQVGGRVIGVISVESESPDAFTENDERLLATLANQTAIAFENARLYEAMQKELSERKRAEDALRASETHYRALADSITDLLFEMDHDLHYTHWNKATEILTGIPAHVAIGKSIEEILGINEEQARIKSIYEDVISSHLPRTFETSLSFGGEGRSFEVNAYPSLRGVSVVAKDVTDRKRTETIMQKRFELMDFSAKHSLSELMQRTVDEVSELTGSTIGFFHFMQEDQNNLGMQTWSTNALRLFERPAEDGGHLPLDQAGVWAEAVRHRRPLIQNDYESLADKKGIPQGHVPIIREMVIPIIRNERIMAVMGIANKPQEYTSRDLEIVARLADYAWDITERKQMELALETERNQLVERVEERTADLSRANSNLARALRVKDEFLANMSHELRTPLNAILGLSESLSEQIAGPLNEKQQKYIATISESGHHLLALINDILDLAKIDAGQITMDINKVDIHSVCQASLRMVKQLAQKRNQDVSLEIDPGLGLVWADERRLKQMIVNLLGNAVKFTPENGRLGLEVHGDQEANQIAITVWDNGIGINEDDLARLFQPFVQLDSGLAREATGTGLGLALVAQMARLHGGGVNVFSEPGKGSRFTIVLPWEPVLAIDTAARMRITGKFRAVEFDETNKPTILLIEDTKEVTMMLKDYLELAGYRVFTAQDGIDGLVQARHVKPDLILMDIQMPRMDGFETTRKLRNDPTFGTMPIIALTALAMPHDRERCLEAGMDEYVSKPVDLKALLNIIQNCLFAPEPQTQ